MADRKFELILNTSIEDEKELHAQFRHHLEHVVKARVIPGTQGKYLLVSGRDEETKDQIFGGPECKFKSLYHIIEINQI